MNLIKPFDSSRNARAYRRIHDQPEFYAKRLEALYGAGDAQMILDRLIVLAEQNPTDAVAVARKLNY